MGRIAEIVSGMGILIALYIIISNGTKAGYIVSSIGGATTDVVKTLQGR